MSYIGPALGIAAEMRHTTQTAETYLMAMPGPSSVRPARAERSSRLRPPKHLRMTTHAPITGVGRAAVAR
jgi:hypothetical protein